MPTIADTCDLLISPESIHPLNGCFYIQCWWLTRLALIGLHFKTFYPLINLLLIHSACSILCQHLAINSHRFDSLCSQKAYYSTLFLDGAFAEWIDHMSVFAEPCHSNATSYLSSNAYAWCCISASLFLQFQNCFTFWFNLVFLKANQDMNKVTSFLL